MSLRSNMMLLVVGLPLIVFGTGCAELRSEFIPATGAPLAVFDESVRHTGTRDVVTGHDDVRDRSGRRVATSTHYEKQNYSYSVRTYYPLQGGQRIDDESFFRITQDVDAMNQHDAYHQGGVTKTTVGWVLLSIGLGVLGGGIASYIVDTPASDDGERGTLSTLGWAGGITGLVLAGLGVFSIADGHTRAATQDARVIEDPARMKADAARYNAAHGLQEDPVDDGGEVESRNGQREGWPWNVAKSTMTVPSTTSPQ